MWSFTQNNWNKIEKKLNRVKTFLFYLTISAKGKKFYSIFFSRLNVIKLFSLQKIIRENRLECQVFQGIFDEPTQV